MQSEDGSRAGGISRTVQGDFQNWSPEDRNSLIATLAEMCRRKIEADNE